MTDIENRQCLSQQGQSLPEHSKKTTNSSHNTAPSRNPGFRRTWCARSTDIRPTPNSINVKWGTHWTIPASIVILLFIGTASAVAHHVFYSGLHNTTVGDEMRQQWTTRIGNGFSIITKFTLAAAIGVSRTQWVWLTLRKKWLTLSQLDSLFGVVSDPMYFLNLRMLKNAKAATVMALAIWVIPLTIILTPSTISVYSSTRVETVPCTVRSMLFPFDRHPPNGVVAGTGNMTEMVGMPIGAWPFENSTVAISVLALRFFTVSAYTGNIVNPPDLLPVGSPSLTTLNKVCEEHCSYSVEFLAPVITCPKFTSWNWGNISWHNSSEFMGAAYYRAAKVWQNRTEFLLGAESSAEAGQIPIVLLCEPSIARYTVRNVIEDRRFHEPVITKVEPVRQSDFEPIAKDPEGRFLSQSVLMDAVYRVVKGSMSWDNLTDSAVSLTPFADEVERNRTTLISAVERMAQNMIVSLLAFSVRTFYGTSYTLDVLAVQQTNCTRTHGVVLYDYSAGTLISVYVLAVGCTLVMALAGFFALRQNGMASDTSVSAIIRTTRNSTLDRCIVGQDRLGGIKMSDELQKLELQFGVLRRDEKLPLTFGMGVKGEIHPIKRDW